MPVCEWSLPRQMKKPNGIFPAWNGAMMPRIPLQRPGWGKTLAIGATVGFALWMLAVVLVYAQEPGEKIGWGADYATWPLATGFVLSPSHGNRFFRVYASTREAANVYRHNGERLRYFEGAGTQPFPEGAVLAMESFERTEDNKVGAKGPVFFLRKESAGYDPEGGDWHYAMTEPDLKLLAEGKDKNVTQCRACHARAKARDFVFAKDR